MRIVYFGLLFPTRRWRQRFRLSLRAVWLAWKGRIE